MEKYRRTFYMRRGKERYRFRLELTIDQKEGKDYRTLKKTKGYTVSICGELYYLSGEPGRPVTVSMGQIDMDAPRLIKEGFVPQKDLVEVLYLWRKWHLNDLTAGTFYQELLLDLLDADRSDYEGCVETLKKAGYHSDRGYKYGHGWLFRPVPEDVVKRLRELFSE
ncbi:hypothetical protein DRO48_00840 [Candidatus Bathyarchaeota archaeon]|nr:MAG: hypothetical protein DRO48_00840 [Candidatus Bathyarchaeota archaeon]